MARLFFALWPPPGAREPLAAAARDVAGRCGGRAVPPAKIHLTLAFLGDLPEEGIGAIVEAAGNVRGSAFSASFDRLGAFHRAGVAWAGCSRTPAALGELAAALAQSLRGLGVTLEDRPFTAHVTLARRIGRTIDAPLQPAVEWRADAFALVESDLRTGRYAARGSWNLGAR